MYNNYSIVIWFWANLKFIYNEIGGGGGQNRSGNYGSVWVAHLEGLIPLQKTFVQTHIQYCHQADSCYKNKPDTAYHDSFVVALHHNCLPHCLPNVDL